MTDEPQELDEIRNATLRGLRWVVIARPMVECVLLASMVVLARLITPTEFGHFAIALLIIGLGNVSVAAMTIALVQRPTLEREVLRSASAISLLAGALLVGLTLLAAQLLVVPIFGTRTAELVRLSAPGCLVASASAVSLAVLQRQLAFRRLSVIDVTATAVRGVVSVILAFVGLQGTALVIGVLASTVAQTALSWVWAPPPVPRPRWRATKDVLHFGLPNWLAGVSWIAFQNCDYAIVGARLGALQAGYYFRAYTLAVDYQKKVSQVMATVGFPVLARTRRDDEMSELRSRMVRLLTVTLFPLLALLAVVAPVAVPWVLGPEWQPAVAPTQILVIGGAATLVIDTVGSALMAAGRPRAILGFGWAHFAVYAAAVFLTTGSGLTAVAAAAAVVHTAFVFVAYVLLLRGTRGVAARVWRDVGPALTSCAALIAVSLPASVAMSAIHAPTLLNLTVVTLAAAAAYTVTLRSYFRETWGMLISLIRHLLPDRSHRETAAPVEVLPTPATIES
jgi:PST family polysaccharide transporter